MRTRKLEKRRVARGVGAIKNLTEQVKAKFLKFWLPQQHQIESRERSEWFWSRTLRVHEKTQLKFGSFHETKTGMVEPVCEQLNRWKQKGLGIDVLRMDNAGENKALKQ